jgi:CheY-like chemotaxis protein
LKITGLQGLGKSGLIRFFSTVRGSIGQLLVQLGVIDADALADALASQARRRPLASELYALGYATERQLATALAAQTGWPAVVLDESTIRLDVLEHVSLRWARIFNALIVAVDASRVVIAAARPEDAIVPARELGATLGKEIELRIAVEATLSRTIRIAFRRWKQGERYLTGPEAEPGRAHLSIVMPDGGEDDSRRAQRVLAEDAARSIETQEEMPDDSSIISMTIESYDGDDDDVDDEPSTITTLEEDADEANRTATIARELDRYAAPLRGASDTDPSEPQAAEHALVVDPDTDGRIRMVNELERLGYVVCAAEVGGQALELLAARSFELVFADVATPGIDGLQLCRAIKKSKRLGRTRVVVTTSVVDSGRVAELDLARTGADGYLEKPLDSRMLLRVLRELAPRHAGADHEGLLADVLNRFHVGDTEGAIALLRSALTGDPASPKLHFVLANMLQRTARYVEAVDEYEAVVELQPAYFPALTRLAYLYFRQGLHARAVETWRRALPVCDDPVLRRNIELFMRKLVADMSRMDG